MNPVVSLCHVYVDAGTRYPDVNKRIERFINRNQIFPDFTDIFEIVTRCNVKFSLHLGYVSTIVALRMWSLHFGYVSTIVALRVWSLHFGYVSTIVALRMWSI